MSDQLATIKEGVKGDELIQLVSFNLCKEEYGVEVLKVREIIRMCTITQMPNAPCHVKGIINLRGKVIPIVSMRTKFGLSEIDNDSHTRIMVMDISGELMGFIVDSVSEVIRIAANAIQPSPTVASSAAGQECITGVVNRERGMIVTLDLERIFSAQEHDFLTNLN